MTRWLLLPLLFTPVALPAQPEGANLVTASFVVSTPHGEFDDNTDTGYGFTGSYTRSVSANGVVALGLSGTFLGYGSTSRRVPLSSTIPDILVDVDTNNNTAFLLGVLEVRVPGAFQPYVQATGGGGFFYTTTTLEDTENGIPIVSDTNHDDGTWVWGGGGGIRYRFWQGTPSDEEGGFAVEGAARPRAYVDVGARYLKGSEVEYLREGSLVTDDGEFDIDPRLARSEIEVVQYQIGVTVTF